jgi:hypothetical protein
LRPRSPPSSVQARKRDLQRQPPFARSSRPPVSAVSGVNSLDGPGRIEPPHADSKPEGRSVDLQGKPCAGEGARHSVRHSRAPGEGRGVPGGRRIYARSSLRRELEVVTGVVLDGGKGRDGKPLIGRTRLARVEIGADQRLRPGEGAFRQEHLVHDAGRGRRVGDDVAHGRHARRRAVVVAADEDQRVAVPAGRLCLRKRPVSCAAGDADERCRSRCDRRE